MKKVILGSFAALTLTAIIGINQTNTAPQVTSGNEKAANVWCQVLTDREGCAAHKWRDCSHTNFCEPPRDSEQ